MSSARPQGAPRPRPPLTCAPARFRAEFSQRRQLPVDTNLLTTSALRQLCAKAEEATPAEAEAIVSGKVGLKAGTEVWWDRAVEPVEPTGQRRVFVRVRAPVEDGPGMRPPPTDDGARMGWVALDDELEWLHWSNNAQNYRASGMTIGAFLEPPWSEEPYSIDARRLTTLLDFLGTIQFKIDPSPLQSSIFVYDECKDTEGRCPNRSVSREPNARREEPCFGGPVHTGPFGRWEHSDPPRHRPCRAVCHGHCHDVELTEDQYVLIRLCNDYCVLFDRYDDGAGATARRNDSLLDEDEFLNLMQVEAHRQQSRTLHPLTLKELFKWFTRDTNGRMDQQQFLKLQFHLHSRSQDHWFNERLRAYWANRVKHAHQLGFNLLVLSCIWAIGCITTTVYTRLALLADNEPAGIVFAITFFVCVASVILYYERGPRLQRLADRRHDTREAKRAREERLENDERRILRSTDLSTLDPRTEDDVRRRQDEQVFAEMQMDSRWIMENGAMADRLLRREDMRSPSSILEMTDAEDATRKSRALGPQRQPSSATLPGLTRMARTAPSPRRTVQDRSAEHIAKRRSLLSEI